MLKKNYREGIVLFIECADNIDEIHFMNNILKKKYVHTKAHTIANIAYITYFFDEVEYEIIKSDIKELYEKLLRNGINFICGIGEGKVHSDENFIFGPALSKAYADCKVKETNAFEKLIGVTLNKRDIKSFSNNSEDRYTKEVVVFFIDIVGTRANENDYEKLLKINCLFLSEINRLNTPNLYDNNILKRKVFLFSDCAFIIYERLGEGSIEKIAHRGCYDIAEIGLSFISQGLFFKGGVAKGKIYSEGDIVCGPAFSIAENLERKNTNLMIQIEKNLKLKIDNYTKELPKLHNKMNGSIFIDEYIDTFNLLKRGHTTRNEIDLENIKIKINQSLDQNKNNEKLFSRYSYLKNIVDIIEPCKECNSIVIDGIAIIPIESLPKEGQFIEAVNMKRKENYIGAEEEYLKLKKIGHNTSDLNIARAKNFACAGCLKRAINELQTATNCKFSNMEKIEYMLQRLEDTNSKRINNYLKEISGNKNYRLPHRLAIKKIENDFKNLEEKYKQ